MSSVGEYLATALDHLRDIELMAVEPDKLRAECQRCGGRMTRNGSMDLYRLVEMFSEHAASCTREAAP